MIRGVMTALTNVQISCLICVQPPPIGISVSIPTSSLDELASTALDNHTVSSPPIDTSSSSCADPMLTRLPTSTPPCPTSSSPPSADPHRSDVPPNKLTTATTQTAANLSPRPRSRPSTRSTPSAYYTSSIAVPPVDPLPYPWSDNDIISFHNKFQSEVSKLVQSYAHTISGYTVDKSYAESSPCSLYHALEPFIHVMDAQTKKGGNGCVFMDIGCGYGHLLLMVSRFLPVSRIIGVEFTPEHAKAFIKALSLADGFQHTPSKQHHVRKTPITGQLDRDDEKLIEFYTGDISAAVFNPLFYTATVCYSFNITWRKTAYKALKRIVEHLYCEKCTIDLLIWGFAPTKIPLQSMWKDTGPRPFG